MLTVDGIDPIDTARLGMQTKGLGNRRIVYQGDSHIIVCDGRQHASIDSEGYEHNAGRCECARVEHRRFAELAQLRPINEWLPDDRIDAIMSNSLMAPGRYSENPSRKLGA